jgi:hypothetical protein
MRLRTKKSFSRKAAKIAKEIKREEKKPGFPRLFLLWLPVVSGLPDCSVVGARYSCPYRVERLAK